MVSDVHGGNRVTAPSNPEGASGEAPQYGDLVESCPDALLVLAEDGTIRMVNAAAERMFGYSRGELRGLDHRMLLAEGFRNGFQRMFFTLRREADSTATENAVASAAAHVPMEVYGLRRDGTEFQAEVACSLVVTDAGPPSGAAGGTDADAPTASMIVAIRDTSHRPETDDGLREAMSLLSATLESS